MNVISAPPGWYPHPQVAGALCYWNGDGWTVHVAPAPAPATTSASGLSDGVVVAGLIASVVLPFVGFVIGIVAMAKGRPAPGVAMLVISVLVFAAALNSLAG